MYRIAQFLDTDLGAGLLAFAVLTLAGIGAIFALWPDAALACVGL